MKTVMMLSKSGHICGSACRNGTKAETGGRSTPSSLAELAKEIRATVERGMADALARHPVVKPRTPSLVEQVRAELKRPGNERVVAFVDEERGHVAAFMRVRNFDDELIDLRARVSALADELAKADASNRPFAEITRLQQALDEARRQLERRERAGRDYERLRERYGGDDVPQRPR